MQNTYKWLQRCFMAAFLLISAAVLMRSGVTAVIGVCLCFYALQKHEPRRFTLWLALICLSVRLIAVFTLETPIVSDFMLLHDTARSLAHGDPSAIQNNYYFAIWAYQTFFVMFEAVFLAVWDDPLCLRLVNVLFSTGTVVLAYRILKTYVRPAAAQTAALMACIFPFFAALPAVLTNQISSAFFFVLGLWLLLSTDTEQLKFWRYPLAGAALGIGQLLRPEGLIILTSLAAWMVFSVIAHPKEAKRVVLGVLTLAVVYLTLCKGADLAVRASGINDSGLRNGYPGWKFVVGLNQKGEGSYTEELWWPLFHTLDENYQATEATRTLQSRLIRENAPQSLPQFGGLMLKKLDTMWLKSGLTTSNGPLGHIDRKSSYGIDTAVDILEDFDRGLFFMALTLAAIGLLGRRRSPDEYIPYFIVFASVVIFAVIEAQTRYAYLPQIFVFMSAAFGLDRIGEKLQKNKE